MRTFPISGSAVDIIHGNRKENAYWEKSVTALDKNGWNSFVRYLKDSGIEKLVLLNTVSEHCAVFPSKIYPVHSALKHPDSLGYLLRAAESNSVDFFISVNSGETYSHEMAYSDTAIERVRALAEEILAYSSHHAPFAGWYFGEESGIDGGFSDDTVKIVSACVDVFKNIRDLPVMIGPYFHRNARKPDPALLHEQLLEMSLDYLVVQDGVGSQLLALDKTPEYFRLLVEAIKNTPTKLWALVELFNWEGDRYKSPLIPAPFDRIRQQISNVSGIPGIDRIVCYQLPGIMDNFGFGKQPEASTLYNSYVDYYCKNTDL